MNSGEFFPDNPRHSGTKPEELLYPSLKKTLVRDVYSGRNKSFLLALSLRLLLPWSIISATANAAIPTSGGISFSGLNGPNLSAFTGITEGTFTAAPTMGEWLQATYYGNPGPSILTGPINSPATSALLITDSAGSFDFTGFDFSSNNGSSTYEILGYKGLVNVYNETGALPGTYGPFSFSTLTTPDPTVAVDALIIEIIPGSGTTSVNLDTIDVQTAIAPSGGVQAPDAGSSLLLLCLGLSGFACFRNRRVTV